MVGAAVVGTAVVGARHTPGAPIMPAGVTQIRPAAQRTWYMGATVSWHSSPAPARPFVVVAEAAVVVVVNACDGRVAPVHLSGHTPLLEISGTQAQHAMHNCVLEQNSAPGPAMWSSGQLLCFLHGRGENGVIPLGETTLFARNLAVEVVDSSFVLTAVAEVTEDVSAAVVPSTTVVVLSNVDVAPHSGVLGSRLMALHCPTGSCSNPPIQAIANTAANALMAP